MRRLINRELQAKGKTPKTPGEILKYLGELLLMMQFEFGEMASLRSINQEHKYIPPPVFVKTGMSKRRFDDLHSSIRYSDQPAERPATMSPERYRWRLIDDFVRRFNEHRLQTVTHSDVVFADETMSKWYGACGRWINEGLPIHVAIARKPENGCEIQKRACGRSGVMLRLRLVTTAEDECEQAGGRQQRSTP
jgi:Transposase IS4